MVTYRRCTIGVDHWRWVTEILGIRLVTDPTTRAHAGGAVLSRCVVPLLLLGGGHHLLLLLHLHLLLHLLLLSLLELHLLLLLLLLSLLHLHLHLLLLLSLLLLLE